MSKGSHPESKSVDFDYKQLTEFNPKVVYQAHIFNIIDDTFDDHAPYSIENIVHTGQQYQDAMNAYLYAQNEILPIIRQQGIANIASKQLIEWFNQIHKRIAHTLAINQGFVAGQFTKEKTFNHHGQDFKRSSTKIPAMMEDFFSRLLTKWKLCKKDNIDEIANLVMFVVNNMTHIIPYPTANENTANCFINIILRSLGQPSILIGSDQEFSDHSGILPQAMEKLHTQPELLTNYIKTRLKEHNLYGKEDVVLVNLATQFVKLSAQYIKLRQHFSATQLNNMIGQWQKNIPPALLLLIIASKNPDETQLLLLMHCSKKAASLLSTQQDSLSNSSASSSVSSASSSISSATIPAVVQYQYNSTEKQMILDKLISLTGQTGWKTYNDQGSTAILLRLDNEPLAKQIILALQQTQALQACFKREPGTNRPIIKLTQIQLSQLTAVESLSALESTQTAAEDARMGLADMGI